MNRNILTENIISFLFIILLVIALIALYNIIFNKFLKTFRKGIKAIKAKNYLNATAYFSECIEIKSNNFGAYHNRAISYFCLKEYRKAIDDAVISVNLKPGQVYMYLLLALCHAKIRTFSVSNEYVNKAFDYKPDNKYRVFLTRIKANNFSELGKPDAAEKELLNEIKRGTEPDSIYNDLGFYAIKQKDYKQALDYLNKSIELNPNDAYPYNNRGYAYANLGYFERAFIDFKKSAELDSKNSYLYKFRGLTYHMMGKEIEAKIDLEKAIEMNEDFKDELKTKMEEINGTL